MSKLEKRKRRAMFETMGVVFSQGRGRPVIVELLPTHMNLKLKGTRTRYALTYSAAFTQALNAHLSAERRAKVEARKAAKMGRAR